MHDRHNVKRSRILNGARAGGRGHESRRARLRTEERRRARKVKGGA